jgi:tetratricopeptide (TPR) repeat protein
VILAEGTSFTSPTIPSVAQELEKRIETWRQAAASDRISLVNVEYLAEPLLAAARDAQDYAPLRAALELQFARLAQAKSQLAALQLEIDRLEAARIRHLRYTQENFLKTLEGLHAKFESSPQSGWHHWLFHFTHAVADWELAFCRNLLEQLPGLAPEEVLPGGELALVKRGAAALLEGDYHNALPMLLFLAEDYLARDLEKSREPVRALVWTLIGRIYLHKLDDPENARVFLEHAHTLGAADARILSAWGELAFKQERSSEAARSFMEAMEVSPDVSDGFVGMGMVSEAQKSWDRANEMFAQALETIAGEPDPLDSLAKLAAPLSGKLCHELASRLYAQGKFEQALTAVERAILLGIQGEENFPAKRAHQLKGDILLELDRKVESARAYFEIGQQLYDWQGEYKSSIDFFRKVEQLDKSFAENYYYLSDALRMQSYLPNYPYTDRDLIHESQFYWEAGQKLEPPEENIWPLITRALISERYGALPEDDKQGQWEGIVYLERALFRDPKASNWWSHLVRFYRLLDLYSISLDSCNQALALNPDNKLLSEEMIALLADLGEYHLAQEMLEQRLKSGPSDWLSGILGFILLFSNQPEKAVVQFEEIIRSIGETDDWYLTMYASCLLSLRRIDEAIPTLKTIFSHYTKEDKEYLFRYANTATHLGGEYLEKAFDIFQLALDYADQSEDKSEISSVKGGLGIAHLRRGKKSDIEQGSSLIQECIQEARRKPEIDELLYVKFVALEEETRNLAHEQEIRSAMDKLRRQARARKK